MKEYGVFDVLGPIMIGPSSSHTAGAARLGKIAKQIVGEDFVKATFLLHGSFAKTYKGHGTDKALVAGILGMDPSDERIKYSLEIAEKKGIVIQFHETDLGYEHPNSVKIIFENKEGDTFYIIGSSIGGGSILITDIDGTKVEFTGNLPTLILKYDDRKGSVSRISTILSSNSINIATMKVSREGKTATMVLEADSKINETVLKEISNIEHIFYIKAVNPIDKR
ncbi:MAG: L-serine ammonia-lyase, iron-sulfur-dependent subunit beta [Clostridiaceae bacterium]|uniref:L-serine ammonia-lyase, iron-sulfur-dependent subunit beta n=1 Tax=Clostridium sp. cpc1 TaxID=2016536 RepID=UPI002240BA38|nr:L-serine ammonia-lyase, iron-sulfur-dependent subunit beta [Clostridium sp. cpc1]MBW4829142.1 L-serine ammonia-lyase, iron-sulfur-dependent subunit beta [Clostridiaceae bacterium]MBW4858595.1 L-serine ammonia-lyase, iron-sulfur-dependent subunit beta [Clostridiaceae bacterium]MBW4868289.1 L-serine ammonia-lyase, iron-sulfur-dependent subunit beta [Clostridiaceae bacterium]MCW7999395.1 L-serine ammonia-lyase, iron-sulfur-dependent, subunit beta [Clostridium sp. cpc1]